MRIVGGRLRGRALAAPTSQAIRPTVDRLREALFNILVHAHGDPVTGARVLDLFAGTGALGLEALSRGAAFALFIDDAAEARALLRENVAALGLGGVTRIFRRDARKLGPAHPVEPFSLAFLDPPYGRGLAEAALSSAHAGGWLTPDAMIVVEEAASAAFAAPEARASIFAGAARLDGAGPARDLADDEFRQILGRPALGRRDGHADALEPLAQGRRFHRIVGGLGEAPHDLVRRSLGKGERAPAAAVEAGKTHLLRGGELFETGRAIESERGDRFDRPALNLRQRGRNLLGDEVDASAHQILHCRRRAAIRHVRDLIPRP